MVRNLHCTVIIDSVLANSKTQNAFLFTVKAIFRHDYPLAVEPASTPRPLVQKKKLWEIFYLLICSFPPCLSWLLHSRVPKFRRDLWITPYINVLSTYITSQMRLLFNFMFITHPTPYPSSWGPQYHHEFQICHQSWTGTPFWNVTKCYEFQKSGTWYTFKRLISLVQQATSESPLNPKTVFNADFIQ